MKLVQLSRTAFYRLSRTKRWTPYHPDQRFNFKTENDTTTYLGDSVETCEHESQAEGLTSTEPRYCARARVDITVWDLRQPGTELDKTTAAMVSDPEKHHRRVKSLARMARRSGIQGILYNSVRSRKGTCLVVFLENVPAEHFRRGRWKLLVKR